MMMHRHLAILIVALFFVACNQPQTTKEIENTDTLLVSKKYKLNEHSFNQKNYGDTLHILLKNSFNIDTLEYFKWEPFMFIKTGNFLSSAEKNAITISCSNDSTYEIEFYSKSIKGWIKNDSTSIYDLSPIQFELICSDYNFDGQKDIYIQSSMSNGYALSRGHLLTINPKTKKIEKHPEARDLANMHADFKTKTIISEIVLWNDNGFQGVCDQKNKWIKGQLKAIDKECSSINPQGNK